MKDIKFNFLKSVLACALISASVSAMAEVNIDDFQTGRAWVGTNTNVFTNGSGPQTGSGIVCGIRDTWLIDSYQAGNYVEAMIGAGAFVINSDAQQGYNTSLTYNNIRQPGIDPVSLGLNLGAETAFKITFRYVTHPISATIYATTTTSPGANPAGSAINLVIPASSRPQTISVPFNQFVINSSISQPVNWSKVDGLLFVFTGGGVAPNGSVVPTAFAIESIKATGSPLGLNTQAALCKLN